MASDGLRTVADDSGGVVDGSICLDVRSEKCEKAGPDD